MAGVLFKHLLVPTALAVALGGGGCAGREQRQEALADFREFGERTSEHIRRYQIEVLLPALAVASEADRLRYHEVLAGMEELCGSTAQQFRRADWLKCQSDADRRAAGILGIEALGDYLARAESEGPRSASDSGPECCVTDMSRPETASLSPWLKPPRPEKHEAPCERRGLGRGGRWSVASCFPPARFDTRPALLASRSARGGSRAFRSAESWSNS